MQHVVPPGQYATRADIPFHPGAAIEQVKGIAYQGGDATAPTDQGKCPADACRGRVMVHAVSEGPVVGAPRKQHFGIEWVCSACDARGVMPHAFVADA